MPNQRLRRILNNLQQPLSYSSTIAESISATNTTTTAVTSNENTVALGQKRALLMNDVIRSSSHIFLQAIERKKWKKRKCVPEQQSSSCAVQLDKNDVLRHMNNETKIGKNDKDTNEGSSDNNTYDTIIQPILELRKVYLYGLQTVSELQDLRDAPDAILPGNFCNTHIK